MKYLAAVLAIAAILSLSVIEIPNSYAGRSFSLAQGTCTHALGGSWSGVSGSKTQGTCTISSTSQVKSGVTMNIPNGVTLTVSGAMNVNGTIYNYGTITNDGVINIQNSGTITNFGTITNSNGGQLNILNTSGTGISNNGSLLYNEGTINIDNLGGTTGIYNYNNGVIQNKGTSSDTATINITNTATSSYGIINQQSSTINLDDYSTITVNTGSSSVYGIWNKIATLSQGIITLNGGTITGTYCDGAQFSGTDCTLGP